MDALVMPLSDVEIDSAINAEIRSLADHFLHNELAYLALTGKIEIPLRDALAFSLQTKFERHGFSVLREWKHRRLRRRRIDLAIVDGERAVALMEFKAMATFDCCKKAHPNPKQYPTLMWKDLGKIQRVKNAALYSGLFAVHPLSRIPKNREFVKYFKGMNKALDLYGGPDNVLKECKRTINDFFRSRGHDVTYCGALDAGECFGVQVQVPSWILGPLNAKLVPMI